MSFFYESIDKSNTLHDFNLLDILSVGGAMV